MSDVVSTYEAAQIVECTPDNIRRLARAGRLRAVIETSAGRLFSRSDVEKLKQERQRRAAVEPAVGGVER
jgi:DNA-binding transcriptional MerR regulator